MKIVINDYTPLQENVFTEEIATALAAVFNTGVSDLTLEYAMDETWVELKSDV